MLNVKLPNGTPNMVLKGASLTQHSTLNTQHSTLNTQHSTLNIQHSTLNTQHLKKKRWEIIKVN